jgi:hypothetical protein
MSVDSKAPLHPFFLPKANPATSRLNVPISKAKAPKPKTFPPFSLPRSTVDSYLNSLNPEQLDAVTSDPDVSLQILAGPGERSHVETREDFVDLY